jgi:hypothetical protein
MTANKTVTAEFIKRVTLTVNKSTGGTIASLTPGINCGPAANDCSEVYDFNSSIALQAAPATGWVFKNWLLDCSAASSSTCIVTMNADKAAAAVFGLLPVSLIAPADGLLTANIAPSFSWSASPAASQYQLQIDNDFNFSAPQIRDIGNLTSTQYTSTTELPAGELFWRVRACDTTALCSDWSLVRRFTIDPSLLFNSSFEN